MYNIVGYAETKNNRKITFWRYIDLYVRSQRCDEDGGGEKEEKRIGFVGDELSRF